MRQKIDCASCGKDVQKFQKNWLFFGNPIYNKQTIKQI